MIALPWSCVTALKLYPVGPIDPMVYGLKYEREGWDDVLDITWEGTRYIECSDDRAAYSIVDLPRARKTRDLLGGLVGDQRMKNISPWYVMLTQLHQGVTE